jgi:hypothetical protein
MLVPVVGLHRECQYCWDGQWGRVRCGRLATSLILAMIDGHAHISFRCDAHAGMNNDATVATRFSYREIEEGRTFSLGYKP